MFHGQNDDVCGDKQDQAQLYFKIPDGKCAVGDSGHCGGPGKLICVEDGCNDEFKECMLGAKNSQESLHSRL